MKRIGVFRGHYVSIFLSYLKDTLVYLQIE